MTWLFSTWLTISTITSPIRAPQLPPWPAELPHAQQQKSGVFLPQPLDREVMRRLLYLDHYPELCQNALDGLASLQQTQLGKIDDANHWIDWSWKITAIIGFLTGAIVGYKLGGH
jgi:hypothetical protein